MKVMGGVLTKTLNTELRKDSGVLVIPCNPHSPLKGEECQKVVKVA